MRKKILFCASAVLFLGLLSTEATASVRATGSFFYSDTSSTIGGVTVEDSRFTQSYTAGIRHELTDTIEIGLDIMWYFIETDTRKDSSYSPVLMVNFKPPGMYNLTFGHSRTDSDPSEGEHITRTITYSAFRLPQSRWPSLDISYNISENFNHTSPKTIDTKTTSMGMSSGYGFEARGGKGSVSYRFGDNLLEDNIGKLSVETISHSLGVNYSKSFMNDRLDMSVFANISRSTQIDESSVLSRFSSKVTPTNGLSCPLCSSAAALNSEPALVNNDRGTAAGVIDITTAGWHIGIDTQVSTKVSRLDVYIVTGVAPATVAGYNFGWEVWTSSVNGSWTQLVSAPPVYNQTYSRFSFSVPETTAQFFKVVNTLGPGGAAINVAEIEALSFLLSAPKFKAENTRDSNSMGLRLSYRGGRGSIGYNLSISQSKQDINNSKSSGVRHGINGRYVVIPRYLSLSGAMTSMLSESSSISGSGESGSLSYNFSANSSPLPTLRGSFSYNHNESSQNGRKRYESDSFGLSAAMDIYRGVKLRLSSYTTESKSLVRKSSSGSESVSAILNLRPWKTVSLNLNSSTTKSTMESPTGKSSVTTDSLSGDLNIRLTSTLYYGNLFRIEPSQSEYHSLGWKMTKSINASASYFTSDLSESKRLTLGWAPIPKVGFSFGFSENEDLLSGDIWESMDIRGHIMFL